MSKSLCQSAWERENLEVSRAKTAPTSPKRLLVISLGGKLQSLLGLS